jgi:hypothetical protein
MENYILLTKTLLKKTLLLAALPLFTVSSLAYADIEEMTVYGTAFTFDVMSIGHWASASGFGGNGGRGAAAVGSAYSIYRTGEAKKAYCAAIHAEKERCENSAKQVAAGKIAGCASSGTVTFSINAGAQSPVLTGGGSFSVTYDNYQSCVNTVNAYKEADISNCDATFATKKSQASSFGFCKN